ncbi:hypothetical protein N9242_03195 [Vicingaceae bacterium]|nr:hypothetical protein [Vicingaceae bacterium]
MQITESSPNRKCKQITKTNIKTRLLQMLNRTGKTTEKLPQDLNDLIAKVQSLPSEYRSDLEPTLNRVVEFTRRRRRIMSLIQEALSQLRLDMKYLVFDLESTRRERDEYRNTLEGGEF